MKKMQDENCALILEKIVFDKILFTRKDFTSESVPSFSFQINSYKKNNENVYKITIIAYVEKEKEYNVEISISGFFSINTNMDLSDNDIGDLINKNAVAILMPYIRSEISIITAQPGMECVVMPPINIEAMLKNS